jgi:hypothetical protein
MRKNVAKILLFVSFLLLSAGLMAQLPPPPPPPGHHGETGNQNPAPIGSGMVLLIGLGAAYGAKKMYNAKKENE